MTFEAFKVKASFELEHPREIPRTVEGDKWPEDSGPLSLGEHILQAPYCAYWKYTNQHRRDTGHTGLLDHNISAATGLYLPMASLLSTSPSNNSIKLGPKSSGSCLTQSLCVLLKLGLINLLQLGSFYIAVIDLDTGKRIHAHIFPLAAEDTFSAEEEIAPKNGSQVQPFYGPNGFKTTQICKNRN